MMVIDPITNTGLWKALAPDGISPSTALAMALDTTSTPPGPPASLNVSAAKVSGDINALNNTLRRDLGPIDLTPFSELRFWLNGDRPADGTAQRRFYLEMRLASAAVPLNDPGNTWQRYLPVSQAGRWEAIRLTLADLPAALGSAVTTIQLRCANADSPFNCRLDALIAVREAMIGDVDTALKAELDGILSIGGTAIPAVLHPANGPLATNPPYIQILQYDAAYSRDRTDSAPTRGDFTDQGYALNPPGSAFELYYQITAVADDRAAQVAMLEFVLKALPLRGQLRVNGYPLPFESICVPPINRLGGFRDDRIPLFYKVSTRLQGGPGTRVTPTKIIAVNTDFKSP